MIRATAGLIALALIAACQQQPMTPGSLDTLPRHYFSRNYERVLDRWTQHERLRQGFDLALDVHATFLSWDLRAAQVARIAKMRALTIEEAEVERTRNLEEIGKYADFVIVVQSHFESFANLLNRRKKIWTFGLVAQDGRVARPIDLKVLRTSPDLSTLYPASSEDFTSTYLIRFPISSADGRPLLDPATTRKFTLRIAGAPGQLDLVFQAVAPEAS